MVEFAMIFGLGFLTAALLGLLAAPLVAARAERRARVAVERRLPVSLGEIAAARDQFAAGHAVALRAAEQRTEATGRALPIGLWKGSGMAVAMDLMAAMLSGGLASHEIERDPLRESGVSQVFIAMDGRGPGDAERMEATADAVIASLRAATPMEAGRAVRYPGEETLRVREENLRLGVPVDEEIWKAVVSGQW